MTLNSGLDVDKCPWFSTATNWVLQIRLLLMSIYKHAWPYLKPKHTYTRTLSTARPWLQSTPDYQQLHIYPTALTGPYKTYCGLLPSGLPVPLRTRHCCCSDLTFCLLPARPGHCLLNKTRTTLKAGENREVWRLIFLHELQLILTVILLQLAEALEMGFPTDHIRLGISDGLLDIWFQFESKKEIPLTNLPTPGKLRRLWFDLILLCWTWFYNLRDLFAPRHWTASTG